MVEAYISEGLKVITKDGYKNIEKVKINDEILSHNGKFEKVINIHKKVYTGYIYQISFDNHKIIICNNEQKFYIKDKNGEIRWEKMDNINDKYYIGMIINTKCILPNIKYSDKIEYWYILGYFTKYKYIYENKIRLLITHEIVKMIKMVSDKYYIDDKYIYIYDETLNIDGIPEWVQDIPKEYLIKFIEGYEDNDKQCNNYKIELGMERVYIKIMNNEYTWNKIGDVRKKYERNYKMYNISIMNNNYIIENIISGYD
jgi:hypothetical protein